MSMATGAAFLIGLIITAGLVQLDRQRLEGVYATKLQVVRCDKADKS